MINYTFSSYDEHCLYIMGSVTASNADEAAHHLSLTDSLTF